MKERKFYASFQFVFGLIVLVTLIATVQSLMLPLKTFADGGLHYTEYNNYIIFKQSFFHLVHNKDLYILYPAEQWDVFKYSPTFALFMAPLSILPDYLGLFIWNMLNAGILFVALWRLPFDNNRRRLYALGFILIELITSIQNSQSNALIAGLIILAFLALEKKQVALASFFIICTVFIKLFGFVAIALFILYDDKIKAALYCIGWLLVLGLMPLLIIPPAQLIFLYKSWGALLHNDQVINYGLSVMGWLYTWFNLELNKTAVVAVGAVLFCIPLLSYRYFKEKRFKLFFLSSILLWVIIFNHKAESPTFVIAAEGIAIWYFNRDRSLLNTILLIFAFVFTILSATDVFPMVVKRHFLEPYVMKVVPCIFIWMKIIWDLSFYRQSTVNSSTTPR